MDVTLLRKLTKKSIVGFGVYKENTVDNLIKCGKGLVLVYYYYKYNKITFVDEVLDEIDIPTEFRISKPDSDLDMYQKWVEYQKSKNNTSIFASDIRDGFIQKNRGRAMMLKNVNKIAFSKASMQRRNQSKG